MPKKILKDAREKCQVTNKGEPNRVTAFDSEETLKTKRAWTDVFQILKQNNCQPRLMYPAK
jgi:hypothetical protein